MSGKDTEIEVKFYMNSLSRLENQLKQYGARLDSPRILERNLRFDTSTGELQKTARVLRLRMDTIARLTYKGPGEMQAGARSRQELEVTVSNFDTTKALLEALGYQVEMMYEKYRTTYDFADTSITLDEMPYGKFCEIEGPDGNTIQQVANRLAIKWERRVLDSYVALFDRLRISKGLAFTNLTFENFKDLEISPQDLGVEAGDN